MASLAALLMLVGSASAQVTNAFFDFESPGFDSTDSGALGTAGFNFFFSSTGGIPGDPDFDDFSGFIANAPALGVGEFPTITTTAVGDAALEGDTSLVFFADVESSLFQDDPNVNNDPRNLNLFVFQQQTITAADIGASVDFSFLFSGAPLALNDNPNTLVEAFITTIDPNNNFAATNDLAFDLSVAAEGETLAGLLELDLTAPELEGQFLQFGVRNSFSDGQNPAVIVDNLQLIVEGGAGPDGDFNDDGVVNAADFVVFRDGGSPNGVGQADFDAFIANFNAGSSTSFVVSSAVPEPSALLLLFTGLSAVSWRRR